MMLEVNVKVDLERVFWTGGMRTPSQTAFLEIQEFVYWTVFSGF
jgi:hypothetical protein